MCVTCMTQTIYESVLYMLSTTSSCVSHTGEFVKNVSHLSDAPFYLNPGSHVRPTQYTPV